MINIGNFLSGKTTSVNFVANNHSRYMGNDTNAWLKLSVEWEADRSKVEKGIPCTRLAPLWEMFYLGDGSPTRHLRLLTGEETCVQVIEMQPIGLDATDAPEIINMLPGPWFRRQVWLTTSSGRVSGYAASWWNEEVAKRELCNPTTPIGKTNRTGRRELFRDIRSVFCGRNAVLEDAFGYHETLWGRYYMFFTDGAPFSLIYEVFSPGLQDYLGPMYRPLVALAEDGSSPTVSDRSVSTPKTIVEVQKQKNTESQQASEEEECESAQPPLSLVCAVVSPGAATSPCPSMVTATGNPPIGIQG